MKHLIITSVLLMALVAPSVASAYDFVENGICYKTDFWNDDVVEVADWGEDGNKYSGDVVVPTTVTNDGSTYTVTAIGYFAFKDSPDLTSVSIPATVTEIGDHAFENCASLANVNIPDNVTTLGKAVFENCSSLTAITIPAGVTKIDLWAFQNCTSLTDVYCHITDPAAVDMSYDAFRLDSENYSSRTLHVPAGTAGAYKNSDWKDYFGTIVEM